MIVVGRSVLVEQITMASCDDTSRVEYPDGGTEKLENQAELEERRDRVTPLD